MCNVGKIDRVVRIVLGVAIIGWGIATGSLWGLVGLIPLGTAVIGFCPLYPIFKINTGCKTDQKP